MALVIRVRFKRASKFYDFDPNGLDLHHGMWVVTETARGVELGECMSGIMEVPQERLAQPLKPILRIATPQDLAVQKRNEQYEKEAFDIAVERIADHKLEMKLVDVEYAFDHSKIIFYFTANGRVDFRMLVKNLASIFKTRIELRQIGVRDEAKMLGGIGPCGRPICCRSFLSDFTPVSIKMAKEQNLSLNPTKISGLCDRLMCCLKYEQDHYEAVRKRMPRVGREIVTPDGVGTINAINVLEETVRVRIAVGDSFELREYPIDDCTRVNQEGHGNPASGAQDAQPGAAAQAEAGQEEISAQTEQPARAEKAAKPPRTRNGEHPEKRERRERGERPDKPDRQDRQERPRRGDRPPKRERPPRENAPQEAQPALAAPKPAELAAAPAPEAKPVKPVQPAQPEEPEKQAKPAQMEEDLQLLEQSTPEDLL